MTLPEPFTTTFPVRPAGEMGGWTVELFTTSVVSDGLPASQNRTFIELEVRRSVVAALVVPSEAERVAGRVVVIAPALAVNVPEVAPDAIVNEAGADRPADAPARATTEPAGGAGLSS